MASHQLRRDAARDHRNPVARSAGLASLSQQGERTDKMFRLVADFEEIIRRGVLTLTSGIHLNLYYRDMKFRNLGIPGKEGTFDAFDVRPVGLASVTPLVPIELGTATLLGRTRFYIGVEAWRGMCLALISSAAGQVGLQFPRDVRHGREGDPDEWNSYRGFRACLNRAVRWV